MDNKEDREFVYNTASNAIPLSKISMVNNPDLIMFYCIYFMRDSIYYIQEEDTIAICDFNEEVLQIQDVFTKKDVNLDKIINTMMKEQTKKVVLGFTPKDISCYEKNLINEEDTTLFIKRGKNNLFKTADIMFPLLSHA